MSTKPALSLIFNETAFREAVKLDLKDVADYGSDDTFTVGGRAWAALYGEAPIPEEVADAVYQIVDEEWDRWFEEGPIDGGGTRRRRACDTALLCGRRTLLPRTRCESVRGSSHSASCLMTVRQSNSNTRKSMRSSWRPPAGAPLKLPAT